MKLFILGLIATLSSTNLLASNDYSETMKCVKLIVDKVVQKDAKSFNLSNAQITEKKQKSLAKLINGIDVNSYGEVTNIKFKQNIQTLGIVHLTHLTGPAKKHYMYSSRYTGPSYMEQQAKKIYDEVSRESSCIEMGLKLKVDSIWFEKSIIR